MYANIYEYVSTHTYACVCVCARVCLYIMQTQTPRKNMLTLGIHKELGYKIRNLCLITAQLALNSCLLMLIRLMFF